MCVARFHKVQYEHIKRDMNRVCTCVLFKFKFPGVCFCQKISRNGWNLTKDMTKTKSVTFFETQCSPYINKFFMYISPICREALHGRICMKFCTGGHLVDVNNCAKFYTNRVTGFDSVGSNFSLSHRNKMSPLTQGSNYRSACNFNYLLIY